ncbi:MAG: hypothetical protein QW786_03385, partial [Candidatus Hadarchaeum sp.]
RGNEYFQACKPWENLKRDKEKAAGCILTCANLVKILCVALTPFMPSTATKLARQLAIEVTSWDQAKSFDLSLGHQIGEPMALFTKVKSNNAEKHESKLISIDEFGKLDIRIGRIVGAEIIPKSKRLLKLDVDLG